MQTAEHSELSSPAGFAGASSGATEPAEKLAFYISRSWPKTRQAPFPDVREDPGARILEKNFEAIRAEVLERFGENPEEFRANFTPYAYREQGWRTVNLYSYFLRNRENCARFPVTDAVVRQIPGMSMAQIAVLNPRTRVKAHFGDTNGILRMHMGLVVPGALPDLGIRMLREDRCWEEGKVFAISISQRHFAWNDTDHHRIVLVVDRVRPEYDDRRLEVASNALAVIAMKFAATRLPMLKDLPSPLTTAVRRMLALAFRLRIRLQRAGDLAT
jgi:aspartyl/asparaginyl beta-hydroxylase (cupin superfamily)